MSGAPCPQELVKVSLICHLSGCGEIFSEDLVARCHSGSKIRCNSSNCPVFSLIFFNFAEKRILTFKFY
jgi:hypothetical protein